MFTPLRLSSDDEPAGAVADAPPKPPTEEEQVVPATEQEQEAPEEEVADSGAGGPEEEAAAPEGEEEPQVSDDDVILDGIDDRAKASPEFAEELRKKYAPPDAAEQQARVQTETNQAARQQRVSQAAGQAFQYLGQNISSGLDAWLGETETALQANVEGTVKEAVDSGSAKVGPLLDTRTMRDQLTSYVQQAQVTYGNWREANIAHTLMMVLEQSTAHHHLTAEQREAVRQAQQMPSLDESLAVQVMIHLQASDNSSDETFKAKTKQELEQELGLVKKGEELLEKLGNGARARPARGGTTKKGPTTLEEIDEALRTGPTAAIDGLLKRRAALTE